MHSQNESTSHTTAMNQWEGYCEALSRHGWTLHTVGDAPRTCPDSVFVEDTAIVFQTDMKKNPNSKGNIAIISHSMGAEQRRGEVPSMEIAINGKKEELFDRIEYLTPGPDKNCHLDGGDVLKCPASKTVYVGITARTTIGGINQLQEILKPEGYKVIGIPTNIVLHLKSNVTALPCGTVIGYEPIVDDSSLYDKFMAMPEEGGAHVVLLDNAMKDSKNLLMSSAAPLSKKLLESLGYNVETVDIGEFEKYDGCVTCLSVRVRTP